MSRHWSERQWRTVRDGYRRVHVLPSREGWETNVKKTRIIYNELDLQVRNKHPKRPVRAKLREDRQEAAGPNEVWAMDFVHDQLAMGKKLRILTVVDTHSRLCPAAGPTSPTAAKTLCRPWNGSAPRSAIRRRSGSTTAASSSPGTAISGRWPTQPLVHAHEEWLKTKHRRGGRVVEGARLESV